MQQLACLAYWKDLSEIGDDAQEKSKAKGFLKTWLNKDKLHLLFILLDTAEIFTRLQLKFQTNQLTILQIPQHKDIAIAQLTQLAGAPKIGGWEELFIKSTRSSDENAEECVFFGHMLQTSNRRQVHAFVTTSRDFKAVRNEIIMAATNFLQEILDSNELMNLSPVFNPTMIQSAIDAG